MQQYPYEYFNIFLNVENCFIANGFLHTLLVVVCLCEASCKDYSPYISDFPFIDCQDAYEQGEDDDTKLYIIKPSHSSRSIFKVRCLFDGHYGWTIILNRMDGSVSFSRDIFHGFGDIDGEFWSGRS